MIHGQLKYKILSLFIGVLFCACNKDVQQFPEPAPADTSSSPALAAAIAADADYSLFSEIIKKSGYTDTLNNKKFTLTLFAPTNAAVKTAVSLLTGGQIPTNAPDAIVTGFIQSNNFPAATANGLVKYSTVPQLVDMAGISSASLNVQFPAMINPAPDLSALARLSVFLSKAGSVPYVNNVPVTAPKTVAGNGCYYGAAAVVMPPTRLLWQRISEAPDLTYLEAAFIKADEGLSEADKKDVRKSMRALVSSFGPSVTLFAPTDNIFKATLTGLIYQKLVEGGMLPGMALPAATDIASTPAVFNNPAVATVLTPGNVRGLLAYHMLGSTAFSNNFPVTETEFPTLISQAPGETDPKLKIKAGFTGPMVTSLTVKGAINPTAANVSMNPLPEPNGSSDQFYVNGTLFKIDQILLPVNF